jgi:hypothetical protein
MTKPILRGVVVLTAGVAGVLLSVIYHLATSPSFLWPRALLNAAQRAFPKLSVTDKHYVVFTYGLIVKAAVVMFHHLLCAHLFADAIDASDLTNQVIFFVSGFFVVSTLVGAASIIGDNSAKTGFGPLLMALRQYSDGMLREVDIMQGLVLHASLALIALAPVSYLHGKILFNRAYAAVLGTEMRRRRVISLINAASASKSVREYYLHARNFTRKVLGLRAIGVSYARPLPTTRPGLDHDLTKLGPVTPDARRALIAARVRPVAEALATNFGLQKTAFDSTFTETPVEVASNLGNAVEALSHWLCNAMDAKPLVARGRETEAHFRDAVEETHAHLFQNYQHWGEYTGMLDRAVENARAGDKWASELNELSSSKDTKTSKRGVILAAFMAADHEAMWDKSKREQSMSVSANAQLHHLCLWFLLYGESANLRHTSEVMCFIFHAAMCALTLEDRIPEPCPFDGTEPSGAQLVLAQPVEGSEMPYPADDYLDSVVRPLYAFLQREVQGRASSPIVDRVMYDDVNEFFWLRERFKAVLPPEDGHAGAPAPGDEETSGWVGVPEAMRGLPVEARMYAHFRA